MKFYPTHKNVWNVADREKFPSVKVHCTKYKRCYLCQSLFRTMDIKNQSTYFNVMMPALITDRRNNILYSQL